MRIFWIFGITALAAAGSAAAQNMDAAPAMQAAIIQGATNANIIRGMYDGGAHVGTSGIYVGRPGSRDVRDRLAAGRDRLGAGRDRSIVQQQAMFTRPATADGAAIALRFTSTPALRREAANGLVERASAQNPEAGAALRDQLAKHDFPRIYAGIVKPFGYRTDDTADAVAAYTLLGWLIATGAADPSPRAAQAVRAQVAGSLSSNATFANPRTRAELAEEMKLLFVTLHAGWQSARREGNLKQYSDGVNAMFRNFTGNNLRAMRLTEQGFVRG